MRHAAMKINADLRFSPPCAMDAGMKRILACILAFSACACSPNVDTRGHIIDPEWKAQIRPGESTHEDVLAIMGSPSTTSSFGDETWYYIAMTRESHAFFKPKIAQGDVVRVSFEVNGVVKTVEFFDETTMRNVSFAKRETPTEGHQMTVLEQMLGNIGRFNSSSPSGGPGRRTGGPRP
jgi:outer membrane protein assembly factor BamE (lipoprotein component of BamABCDE complex)